MTTREENIKKINDELEKLSDDELDQVAGGTYLESANDARRFQEIGVKIFSNEILGVPILQHEEFVKLRNAFKDYGVTIKDNGGLVNENQYFIGGKEVSREDAWKHIRSQVK